MKSVRFSLTIFIVSIFLVYCQGNAPVSEPVAKSTTTAPAPAGDPIEYKMTPDTVTVMGKFLSGCSNQTNIRIAIHNVDNSWWKDVPVTNGQFSYKFYLNEPRRVALRTTFGNKVDLFATTNEKVYNVEITCTGGRDEKFAVKGSAENDAYVPFSEANKKHQADLDSFAKMDINKKETFAIVQQTIRDYQKKLADIAKAHPNTYTAKVLIATEQLPDNALNSLEELQKNFLNRPAYALPYFYNDFLPQRIILNYFAIRNESSNPDAVVATLTGIGMKNREAARKLQDIMYNLFYKMHQEDLLIAYIKWADANPTGIYDQSVKQKLQNIKKVIAGSNMIDLQLNDPSGKPQKLSDAVKSSKATVLIFYGPTCGHCKEKIPELIPLWDQYKDKGLKIFAVGKESTIDEWNKFIKEHAKSEWIHVFQPETGVQPADWYYIDYTPAFIIIDGQGKIISRLADIENVLEEVPQLLK